MTALPIAAPSPAATADGAAAPAPGDAGHHDFARLVEPYRRELHAHCYRMLGSVHDADDALQEALLRAWRGLPGFAGRSSLRTWLHTIAANTCLRMIERRGRRALPVDVGPAAEAEGRATWRVVEAGWVEPYAEPVGPAAGRAGGVEGRYEQREDVELAFVAALQQLPGSQRAALILRDVLGFSAKEVAAALDTSVASVTSALARARRAVDERRPDRSQQATLRALGDAGLRRLVAAYVDAWHRGDADAIVALLAEDATFSMPPYATWFQGRDAIAAFLLEGPLTERWRMAPVRANGQPAFACYCRDDRSGAFLAHSLDVLTVGDGGTIAHVTAFLDADVLLDAGLPATHPG